MAWEKVAHRQHIAMKMHAALRSARRTACKSDQADIVGRRIASIEMRRLSSGARVERIVRIAMKERHLCEVRGEVFIAGLAAPVQFIGKPSIAQRSADARLI